MARNAIVRTSTTGAIAATDAVIGVVEAMRDYLVVASQEQTKRESIRAESSVRLAQINAQKQLLLTYLDKTFDERRSNFERFFSVLDTAVEQGNAELALGTLQSILDLAKSCPFKLLSIADTRRMLKEDAEIELEY